MKINKLLNLPVRFLKSIEVGSITVTSQSDGDGQMKVSMTFFPL